MVKGIKDALRGQKLEFAFDCVSEKGSHLQIVEVLDDACGKVTFVLPWGHNDVPPGIQRTLTMAGSLWRLVKPKIEDADTGNYGILVGHREFESCFSTLSDRYLQEGVLAPHPYEVIEGGLAGVETALKVSKDGRNRELKHVVRIEDTPGLK